MTAINDEPGHVFPAIAGDAAFPDLTQTAEREKYVILQAWQTDRLRVLKAANPNLKVLVYQNLAFCTDPGLKQPASSGVPCTSAPDAWFLRNRKGHRFASQSFPWLWAMDIGLRSYQRAWAANVNALLHSGPWDGVFIDDADPTMKYAYPAAAVAKYPDDAAYSAAMGKALAFIGPRIRADDKLAIANFATWVEYPRLQDSWLSYLDGALDEMFVKWGDTADTGYRDLQQWKAQVAEAAYASARGKIFLAFTHGPATDIGAAIYGYASLLMAGNSASAYAYTADYSQEIWIPEYDYQIGHPLRKMQCHRGLCWRQFSRGIAIVDAGSSPGSLRLGARYSGSGLHSVDHVMLRPNTALVMTADQPSARPPSPVPVSTAPISLSAQLRVDP